MNLKLELEFSKADILKEVDTLKKQFDAMRPLPEDVEGRVMQKLRLDWNYHSNAIEGNRLNYGETVAFLMEGITAKGKPLKDHLDIRGHNEAINFLLEIVKDTRPISESDIRALHKMILVEAYDSPAKTREGLPTTKRITLGEYKTSPNHVKTATGEIHYYATPDETPAKMQELMEWYGEVVESSVNPAVIAALFHHKFVAIHPFDDGNGRLSRILMNLILMQNGYPPVVVKMDDRTNYYSLLSRADVGDSWPFVEYITELLQGSLQLYLKAAHGDDIDEEEDIDKEIALFKLEVQENQIYKEKRSLVVINRVIKNSIDPLTNDLFKKAEQFNDLFNKNYKYIEIDFDRTAYNSERFSAFNKNFYDFLPSRYYQFLRMEIYFLFTGFKSMKKTFDVDIRHSIVFNLYDYSILNDKNELIIKKKYHEELEKMEKKVVIKSLIEDIKTKINVNLKNQKSPKP